jgi:hypothetical protein
VTDFPREGDSFVVVGPWRILEGRGWRRWQMNAIEAEIAAARANMDEVTAARKKRELEAKKGEGP